MKKNNKKSPSPSKNSVYKSLGFASAIAVTAFIVYAHTISFEFVFDDIENILNNPAIIHFQPSQLLQTFTEPWRAVIQLSYGFTYYIFGFNPAAFHLFNVLIHVINSVLVFGIARLLAKRWISPDKAVFFSVAAGMIFAVHPLHSEAVAYVWGRSSSLCALFYFGSLLLILIGFSRVGWKRILWFGCALIVALLAWKTKEEAVTLPLVAAGMVALIGAWRTSVGIAIAPFLLIAAQLRSLIQLRPVVAENQVLVSAGLEPALDSLPYFLTSMKGAVFYYLKMYIFPEGQSADAYLKPVSGILDPALLFALTVLAALVVLGFILRKDRLFLFGLLALLISPLTSYAIMPLADVVAEHRIYISGLGFSILAAWILARLPRYRQAVLAGIVVILGFATLLRAEVWADSLTLWKDAAMKYPELARPHLNLGVAYQTAGADDLAMTEYKHALSVKPDLPPAYINMAGILYNRNDLDNSENTLRKAMELAPTLPAPYLNLAQIAMRKSNPQEAMEVLNKMPEEGVSYLFHLTKGDTYAQLGQYTEAVAEYEEAVRLRPDLPEVAALVKDRLDRLKKFGAIR